MASISVSIFFSQIASFIPSNKDLYSTFVDNKTTAACLLLILEIGDFPRVKMNPVVDLLIS